MPTPLDAVPNGSDVLIDSNIFVYGLTANSIHCRAFLERCSREDLTGVAVFESVNDATHQFMKGEAVQKGLCARKAMEYLSAHPEKVQTLSDYWVNTQRILALNILFVPLEEQILTRAQIERVNAGVLTNDSVIVAAMRQYGISLIATNDQQFGSVAGITVYSPTDV
jgi:predicted nucleic acid-binding protein